MIDPAPQTGRLCDAGLHQMDPNWDTCPYCRAEKKAKERTQPDVRDESAVSASDRRTRVGGAPAESRRETRVMPSTGGSSPAQPAGEGDTRRIVGVLITYTWRPEGQLFAVREGKNFIGAGKVGSAPGEPDCEILIANDPKMSSLHASILCRAGRYDLVDQGSSNGTFLEEELVPLQGTSLPNYAEITTGSTVWTFIKITPVESDRVTPSSGRADSPRRQDQVEPETKSKPEKDDTKVG